MSPQTARYSRKDDLLVSLDGERLSTGIRLELDTGRNLVTRSIGRAVEDNLRHLLTRQDDEVCAWGKRVNVACLGVGTRLVNDVNGRRCNRDTV